MFGSQSIAPVKKEYTCHFCTTCHDPELPMEELPTDLITPLPDIEDIKPCRSGVIMFQAFIRALKTSNWEEIPVGEQLIIMGSNDAAIDPNWMPQTFVHKNDSNITLKVLPTRCLSACSFPQVFALNGPKDTFSYQFGGIRPKQIADVIKMIEMYCNSSDGYSSTRTRPKSLRGHVLARIPPRNGRQIPAEIDTTTA
jgi:hypothetical protein